MPGHQRISITGTLGKDIKLISAGTKTLGVLQVFCREIWTNKDGSPMERTQVFTCNLWGHKATNLAHLLLKGSLVQIEGKVIFREMVSPDGAESRRDFVVDISDIVIHRVKENGAYIEKE